MPQVQRVFSLVRVLTLKYLDETGTIISKDTPELAHQHDGRTVWVKLDRGGQVYFRPEELELIGTVKPRPPYEVRGVEPGKLWKIINNAPKDGTTSAIYFVRRNLFGLQCSCLAGKYSRPCKHKRYIANLIGQPQLAETQKLEAAF